MGFDNVVNKKSRMNEVKELHTSDLYKKSRSFRGAKLAESWDKIPGIGKGIRDLKESVAQNLAFNLNAQSIYMQQLSENSVGLSSGELQNYAPENMLKLVRMVMPNVIRGKIFTEFAMETPKDSIKYLESTRTESQTGDDLLDHNVQYPTGNWDTPLHESSQDRFSATLANVACIANKVIPADLETATDLPTEYTFTFTGRAFGTSGEKYVKGYTTVYHKDDTGVIAVQNRQSRSYRGVQEWFIAASKAMPAAGFIDEVVESTTGVPTVTVLIKTGNEKDFVEALGLTSEEVNGKNVVTGLSAFGRYDDEDDIQGEFLGQVKVRMRDYQFRPRATHIGVSWSQMSEWVMDTSYSINAESTLLGAAASEIRSSLDIRAIKEAYGIAKSNSELYTTFDASYGKSSSGTGIQDSYIANAQTFLSCMSTVQDKIHNKIKRGGVSRMICGSSAGTYLMLNSSFTNKGKMPAIGPYQFGEIDGVPVFKVSSDIIPADEIVTVWKNDVQEADVAMAFGTFIPFYSTGTIQRKNFFKEAGLASVGDSVVINPDYFALIKIENLKDTIGV